MPDLDLAALPDLNALNAAISDCRLCPRLVEWREQVARDKRAAFKDATYWGRPVPGFGDPASKLLIVGLAPAAHGGNRTGRVFTGDRSGDWLYGAMHRAGFANQPFSHDLDDGLKLTGAYVSAAVRCAPPANQPTEAEKQACLPFLVRELELLPDLRCIVALGAFAYKAILQLRPVKRPTAFGHLKEQPLEDGNVVLCSFHPSQRNTFTGKLTQPMFDAVFARARELINADG